MIKKILVVWALAIIQLGPLGGKALAQFEAIKLWGNEYELTATHMNLLLQGFPDKSGSSDIMFYSVNDMAVARNIMPNWDCTIVFLLDSQLGQVSILHQEGFSSEPSMILELGERGSVTGKLLDPSAMAVVSEYGTSKSDYSNQPGIHEVYIVDSGNHRIQKLRYGTHMYDAGGHRLSDWYEWSDVSIPEGVLINPIGIDTFSELKDDSGYRLIILDDCTREIIVSGFGGDVFSQIPIANVIGGEEIPENIVCWRDSQSNDYCIAVSFIGGGNVGYAIMKSSTRDFLSYTTEVNYVDFDIVDMEYGSQVGLTFLNGRGEIAFHTSSLSDLTLVGDPSPLDSRIFVTGQYLYHFRPYGFTSGLKKWKIPNVLDVEPISDHVYSDIEPLFFDYSISLSGDYSLMVIVPGHYWQVIAGCDFSPGSHTGQVSLPTFDSQPYGTLLLSKLKNGVVVAQAESAQFRIHNGPTGRIDAPLENERFPNGVFFPVTFEVEYGDYAQLDSVKLVMRDDWGDVLVEKTVNEVSCADLVTSSIKPPLLGECGQTMGFSLHLQVFYPNSHQYQETSGVNLATFTRDCEDDSNPTLPKEVIFSVIGKELRVVSPQSGILGVELFDLRGRRVKSEEFISKSAGEINAIGLSDFPSGVYLVRTHQGKRTYTGKVTLVK